MQFYAIEIARYVSFLSEWCTLTQYSLRYRNRAGLNDWIYEKAQKEASA